MKTMLVNLLIAAGTLGGIASVAAQTKVSATASATATVAPAAASGPKIQFVETVHDLGKIGSGQVVRHDFIFTNTGTAKLEIKEVRPSCGCTTAGTWDKEVEPGKTGVIPLQFNSSGFSGAVAKTATVTCNDPGQSNGIMLQIKANVWKPIDVTPSMAVFMVSSESATNEVRSVKIINNMDEPIQLSDVECTNTSFRAELKTIKPGKEFELLLTAIPPFLENRVITAVTMKTSTPTNPTISISAYLNVQHPVTVMPNHFMLSQGPLTNAAHPMVTIQNTGTNLLVLSEPNINVPGVEVRLQEPQQGRVFTLTADFPVGFQAKLGHNIKVSVKSNHPRFPLIEVPVFQPQPPAIPPTVEKVVSPTQVVPAKSTVSVPGGN